MLMDRINKVSNTLPIIMAVAYVANAIITFSFKVNIISVILSLIWISGFFVLVYSNAQNKVFTIVSWIFFTMAIIGNVLINSNLDFSGRIGKVVAWLLAVAPFLIMMGITQISLLICQFIERITGKEYYLFMDDVAMACFWVFVGAFVVIYFTSRFIKMRKRKDDENVKIENG